MTSLRQKLLSLQVKTVDEGRHFIPERYLKQVLTEPAIKEILSGPEFRKFFYKQNELTQMILEGGTRLLGILVLIGREDAILGFLQYDRFQDLDARLPLEPDDLREIMGYGDGDADTTAAFCEMQWKVLAPVLGKDRSHRIFCDRIILPFIKCESWAATRRFGDLSRITLCPVHQRLVNPDIDGNVSVEAFATVVHLITSYDIGDCYSKEDYIEAPSRCGGRRGTNFGFFLFPKASQHHRTSSFV